MESSDIPADETITLMELMEQTRSTKLTARWLSKRNRGKLSYNRKDTSPNRVLDSLPNEPSVENNQKILGGFTSEKIIGDDGHYYVCVVCELWGDLLCCDRCPQTYHLECLDPPLQCVPNGEWLCPACCKKGSSSKRKIFNKKPRINKSSQGSSHLLLRINVSSGEAYSSLHMIKDGGECSLVDRILGCRAQGDKGQFSDSIPEVDVTNCPKEGLQGSGDEGNSSQQNSGEMHLDGSHDIDNFSHGRKSGNLEKGNIVESSVDMTCCSTDNPFRNLEESLSAVIKSSAESRADGASNSNAEKLIKEPMLSELAPSDKVAVVSYEFLVKWVGKSHNHNTWIPESKLKVLSKRKLDNYLAKYGMAKINLCDEKWKQPHRVIALKSSSDGSTYVFVKWTDLPYDECTWENIDEAVITKSLHLIDLYKRLEHEALEKEKTTDHVKCESQIVTLSEQPDELKGGQLFPHQLEALNWLRKCWHKSKNVILADEMGLGKTVSACAFISSLYYEFKATLPCLVLVPLCTMPNWMAEFAGWIPDLNVVEYHGSAKARSIIRQYEWQGADLSQGIKKTSSYKFNVLLTTYEMVLADSAYLRGIPWEVLVVDEGHRLKNSGSKLFGILNDFSFQHRVLMTGTPLQNNIGELFNLLHFLQRGLFPSLSSFENKFNDLTSAEKVEELKKLVAPHMLRRLKKDAMKSIPPKTERLVPVELSSIQTEIYRAILTKNYQVLRNIGKGVAQQSMLNIVMQLRKVCNHPYLIPGTEPESGSVEFLHDMRIKASAKLTLLHSMLKALHKEGHRVLIFSQMTKLLDILEDYMTIEFGPKTYERVDGSVSIAARQAAIIRFNQDRSRFVFLLSTRSCGLGINLATADTVIIYDSDFNPHADIQAMNRAHRIGQSNQLLVYRIFVRASVEERILQLAKKKLMLDQLFVSKSGSRKELEDILKWGTEEVFREVSSPTKRVEDQSDGQKDDGFTGVEVEEKRKRIGSLGDVYKDTCADGNNKIVWSETDIIKLLDRSNNVSCSLENSEMESENGLLGCVKSVQWNDDTPNEGEASTLITMDATCTQNGKNTQDRAIDSTEENEWDMLLRVRWENLQNEEKEALGRGKRQRKAVSYYETYVQHATGTVSEEVALVGAEPQAEPEPEQDPLKTYSPAGLALKEKYAKLRARQKERLAMRSCDKSGPVAVVQASSSHAQDGNQKRVLAMRSSDESGPVAVVLASSSHAQDRKQKNILAQPAEEKTRADVFDINRYAQIVKESSIKIDLGLKLGRTSNDTPLRSLVPLGNHLQGTSFTNSLPSDNLTPVLGSYGLSASQMDTSQKSCSKSNDRMNQMGSCSDPSKKSTGVPLVNSQQLPAIPFMSNVRNKQQEGPLGLDLNHPETPFLSNVLEIENIMLRVGCRTTNIQAKNTSEMDIIWSEQELDHLWIGVRNHGRNWDAILLDVKLKFSPSKTAAHLSRKWKEEQLKMLEGLSIPLPCEHQKSSSFSSLGMLAQPLNRSTLLNPTPETRFGSTVLSPTSLVNRLSSNQVPFNQANQVNNNQIPPPFQHRNTENHNRLPTNLPHWPQPMVISSGNPGPSNLPQARARARQPNGEDEPSSEGTISDYCD